MTEGRNSPKKICLSLFFVFCDQSVFHQILSIALVFIIIIYKFLSFEFSWEFFSMYQFIYFLPILNGFKYRVSIT